MLKSVPRMLIAGTGSGCGKTTVVCALLQAFKNRGFDVAAGKCGPDYIDPMFHSEIIGASGGNVDLFFTDADCARWLFARHAAQLNVIEGVMGYYDGLSMDSSTASAWHVAQTLEVPAVLVVNVRGMALSAAAVIKGYQSMRTPSGIVGVILNQASAMSYPALKAAIERECGVIVYGYMPRCPDAALESRHLGLVTAQEVKNLRAKMQLLAEQAEKSIDLDGLIQLMQSQPPMELEPHRFEKVGGVRVAVARDKAFCFYYRDNLELLEDMGAELLPFSPMADGALPDCDGLIIGGGYPELYARQLSENESMRTSVRMAVEAGLPTIAECGGFMYLTSKIGEYPMAGAIDTACFNTGRLSRFGYAEISADADGLLLKRGERIRGHEFHYWDAENPGEDLQAQKHSGRSWRCGYVNENLYAGYPHLHFYSNTNAARRFMERCLERKMKREADGN